MSSVRDFHEKAMEALDLADAAARKAEAEQVHISHLERALTLEAAAVELLRERLDVEPTRSVLCRSAGWIAYRLGDLRQAERFASLGLAGEPPEGIANELRDLFDQSNFRRHLRVNGKDLQLDEFRMVLTGPSIGYGIADSDEVIPRIAKMKDLVTRTAERRANHPYRTGGLPDSEIRCAYPVYVDIGEAACYSIRLQIGAGYDQLDLLGDGTLDKKAGIVDELMECLTLFHEQDFQELRSRIHDEAYFTNFVGVSKQLIPDGDRVKSVGFLGKGGGRVREVQFTRAGEFLMPKTTIAISDDKDTLVPGEEAEVVGTLLHADQRNKNVVTLVEGETEYKIRVADGLDDVVKDLWGARVRVRGVVKRIGKGLFVEAEDISGNLR